MPPRATLTTVAPSGTVALAAVHLGRDRFLSLLAKHGEAVVLGTAHPTGFPTYVLLGWLASVLLQPFGEPAFRMVSVEGDPIAADEAGGHDNTTVIVVDVIG